MKNEFEIPATAQGDTAAQYIPATAQGDAAAQYIPATAQGGTAAQYIPATAQGGTAAQYIPATAQGDAAAQYIPAAAQGGTAAQYIPATEDAECAATGDTGGEAAAVPDALFPAEDICAHYDSLCRQSEQLRLEFPDFDLAAALTDEAFLRLTAPGLGVSVRQAYYALHRPELDRLAARQAAEETRRGLARCNAERPREGGGQGGAVERLDYSALSSADRQQLKRSIIAAAARGEKIYPC